MARLPTERCTYRAVELDGRRLTWCEVTTVGPQGELVVRRQEGWLGDRLLSDAELGRLVQDLNPTDHGTPNS